MTNTIEPSGHFSSGDASASGSQPKWWWRMEDAAGQEVPDLDTDLGRQEFPSQSDAESWVGEVWPDLLAEGVDGVTLFEGERRVYGPMSLHSG